MKVPSLAYNRDIINDPWFLILKMNGYLAASVYRFHILEKQKLIKTDRTSHVGWPAPRAGKIFWKTTNIKVSFTEKKVSYFTESFAFQCKWNILKKVLYLQKVLYI